jgi:hypothetical protein
MLREGRAVKDDDRLFRIPHDEKAAVIGELGAAHRAPAECDGLWAIGTRRQHEEVSLVGDDRDAPLAILAEADDLLVGDAGHDLGLRTDAV